MIDQVSGGFMAHVETVLLGPWTEARIAECGFIGLGAAAMAAEELLLEDELAGVLGSLTTHLAVARVKPQLLVLVSWPWSMVRGIQGGNEASACMYEFRQHYTLHEALVAAPDPTKEMQNLAHRSVFNTVAVQQLVEACKESGWVYTDDLRDLMVTRTKSLLGTQLVEDLNNVEKNDRPLSGKGKAGTQHYRRPETCFGAALQREVVNRVHRFSPVQLVEPVVRKTGKLQPEVFTGKPQGSLPFSCVESTRQKADYYSPSVANSCVPAADHFLLEALHAQGALADARDAWKGLFCSVNHQLVFRFTAPGAEHGWFWALFHFSKSSCLVWPVTVTRGKLLRGNYEVIEPIRGLLRPRLMAITTFAGMEGFTFTWRSWAWQAQRLRGPKMRPAVRAIRDPADEPLLPIPRLLAKNAWFMLAKTDVEDICQDQGVELEDSSTLFSVLLCATKNVLGISEQAALEILRIRFSRLPSNREVDADLMQVDEAAACLDQQDRAEFKRAQQEQADQQLERAALSRAFRSHREQLANKGRGNKKLKLGVAGYKGPRKLPPGVEALSQKDLKLLVPPGGYIWVSRNISAWCSHFPPQRVFPAS